MSEPIPISLLAAYVYCPRSAWLAHVGGSFEPNVFTMEGSLLHARVHRQGREEKGERRRWFRVPLYSRRLGLVGYADVVEALEGAYFPIEYKRGQVRHRLSDQVQVCAQGLCLEEMLRRPIETGFVYYVGSRRRVEVNLTGPIRKLTLSALHELRQLLSQPRAPPGETSPRCRGCAQARSCLADGTKALRRFSWKEWLE